MRKKKHRYKKTNDKEKIFFNGRKHTIEKPLDDANGNVQKQYFGPKVIIKKKTKSPCLKCVNNNDGFCSKYKKWCYLAQGNCGTIHFTYEYKDKNHNIRKIKY